MRNRLAADGHHAVTPTHDTYAQIYRVVPFLSYESRRRGKNQDAPPTSFAWRLLQSKHKGPSYLRLNSGAGLLQELFWARKEEGSYLGVGVGRSQGVGAGQCSPLLEGHLGAG